MPTDSVPPDEWKASDDDMNCAGRRAIEKVWPKTRVTTYVSGGLWIRAKPVAT